MYIFIFNLLKKRMWFLEKYSTINELHQNFLSVIELSFDAV